MIKELREYFTEEGMLKNFIWFYSVGLLLFMLPFTRNIFISITWITLILVIALIFLYQRTWNAKIIGWFSFIFFSSFLLELIGVNTGKLFGTYQYDRAFGLQIQGTPVIIGLNWLFLTYTSHDIVCKYFNHSFLRILAGALLMIFYDLILEAAAPVMQMWHFDSRYPPLSNFIVWFGAALIYHTGFELLKIRTDNSPARALFVIQMIFLFVIAFYGYLFIAPGR